jgi:hypothetical protein
MAALFIKKISVAIGLQIYSIFMKLATDYDTVPCLKIKKQPENV